jgi:signal transduction histidine kinase
MAPTFSDGRRAHPRRQALLVYVVGVVFPATVVCAFGLWAILQDRAAIDRAIEEHVEAAADRAGRNIEREIATWQSALAEIRAGSPGRATVLPARIREAFRAPGDGVVLERTGSTWRVLTGDALLYAPELVAVTWSNDIWPPTALEEAEDVEVIDHDYEAAVDRYSRLLATGSPVLRPWALHHLARALKKLGRADEAVTRYRELRTVEEELPARTPFHLIADHEYCALVASRGDATELGSAALDLFKDLVTSRWALHQSRYAYEFYRTHAWEWLERAGRAALPEVTDLSEIEARKRALNDAVDAVLEQRVPRRDVHEERRLYLLPVQSGARVAMSRSVAGDSSRELALVLSPAAATNNLWRPAVAQTIAGGMEVSVVAADGRALYGRAAPGKLDLSASFVASRNHETDGTTWTVRVWPSSVASFYAGVNRREWFYVLALALVVTLLGVAGYSVARSLRKDLEVAELKSDFVAAVSHELRSPLTGIRMLGEILMEDKVESEQRKHQYYGLIVAEAKRLATLVGRVLDSGRTSEGRGKYAIEPVDTSPWLRELAAAFQDELSSIGPELLRSSDRDAADCPDSSLSGPIKIVTAIPDDLPKLAIDAESLGIALHCLLDNAVKYSPEAPAVWLEAESDDAEVRIAIRDRGVGITEEEQKRVFQRFYRSGPLVARVKGVGLGLTLADEIVAAHGGRIALESRPGEGTTVTVHLKRAEPR